MISMAKALYAADQNIVSETGMAARPIVLIVATYIVTTLLQGALGSIPINKILGFALVVLLIFEWVSTRRSHLSYLGLLCFVLLSLHSTLVMISASQELNDLVYLASTMLMISLICSPRFRTSIFEALLQYRTYISVVVISSSMFLLLHLQLALVMLLHGEKPPTLRDYAIQNTLLRLYVLFCLSLLFFSFGLMDLRLYIAGARLSSYMRRWRLAPERFLCQFLFVCCYSFKIYLLTNGLKLPCYS